MVCLLPTLTDPPEKTQGGASAQWLGLRAPAAEVSNPIKDSTTDATSIWSVESRASHWARGKRSESFDGCRLNGRSEARVSVLDLSWRHGMQQRRVAARSTPMEDHEQELPSYWYLVSAGMPRHAFRNTSLMRPSGVSFDSEEIPWWNRSSLTGYTYGARVSISGRLVQIKRQWTDSLLSTSRGPEILDLLSNEMRPPMIGGTAPRRLGISRFGNTTFEDRGWSPLPITRVRGGRHGLRLAPMEPLLGVGSQAGSPLRWCSVNCNRDGLPSSPFLLLLVGAPEMDRDGRFFNRTPLMGPGQYSPVQGFRE